MGGRNKAGCAVPVVWLLAVHLIASDWPQLARDAAKTGYSPDNAGSATNVSWRWHPDRQTSVAGRTQPVVAGGILCVGFYDGKMYMLNALTGGKLREFQAGGPITHTAAMDAERVYFGCHDGAVYAVRLNDATLAWKVQTGGPVQTAPCLAGGTIYIGSEDGRLYAIRTTDGSVLWTYDSGRPILTCAAYANGTVYCGNEGVYAFAVNAANGAERWKIRLRGQSMNSYWPVVWDAKGVVFFRTQPVNVFHEILGEGDSVLGGNYNSGDGDPTLWAQEQNNIRNHFAQKPDSKTFWALNTSNGAEKYVAPVLYTSGEGTTPVPPVIDITGNRAWYICRSRYARFDSGSIVRSFGCEPAKFNPDTGNYTLFATEATKGTGIHVIGDETAIISADAYGLLVSGRGTLGYIRHDTEAARHVVSSHQGQEDYNAPWNPKAYNSAAGWADWSVQAGGGSGGGLCNAAVVADNAIYWFARWGLLVRMAQ